MYDAGEKMSILETGGTEIQSIFQLIGDKENDILKSTVQH